MVQINLNENFYQDCLFTFESYGCYCDVDIIHESPEETRHVIKAEALSSKPIKFAFQPKDGLVRISNKNGSVEESNILSSFISIKENDIDGYRKFFERNGFLFPIGKDKFEELDDESILLLMNKMKTTVELMSQISEVDRKNYKKILCLTLSLLFAQPAVLNIAGKEYKTCDHKLLNNEFKISNDITSKSFMKCDENRMFEVKDSIYGTFKVHYDEYRHYDSYEEVDDFEKALMHSYVNHEDAPHKERLLIEFLYHFYYGVGFIRTITADDIEFRSCPVKWDAFDGKMKDALIEVAKIVIAEEINSNLDGVHAEYDSNVMEPRWKVDSLLSALYFSIFYMKPNIEITRQCANPTCGRYFTVSRTSSKKKYCCDDCRNRALQNRYRAKHRK